MAFRAPQQRPQAPRPQSSQQQDPAPAVGQSQQRKRPLEESQDWILFAPPSQTNTSQTPRTADLSRASYFGSLDTGARSDLLQSDDHIIRQVTASNDDDGTELDSLDDDLHDFHTQPSPRLDQSGGAVLPTHDGLGSFPTTFQGGEILQEQLWQHERYNPQRRHIHRRLSSVQRRLDALEETVAAPDIDLHDERRLRVERWRTEQSKAVLEEIEKETRRRYRRMQRDGSSASDLRLSRSAPGPAASVMTGRETTSTDTVEADNTEPESFWQRITRKVIRDLIGLDENTLSVIFGQELAEELSPTPTRDSPLAEMTATEDIVETSGKTWEERLLDRIARELNLLVYQISELESAFSTYSSRVPSTTPQARHISSSSRTHPQPLPADLETSLPTGFRPTLNRTSPISGPDASLWGIEEEPATDRTQEADYWERDPSLRMLFSYLRQRIRLFSPSAATVTTSTATAGPLPASWATSASALGTSPESQRRADLIRRNHPLVSRATADRSRRETAARRHRSELLGAALHRRQGSSSCASQSTKRSRRSSGTGQSRKYWDFPGGSVESAVGSGGVGGWGEV